MRVVIVGGGMAGLSAAVRVAEGGHHVTLLESRSFCGGRTYSFHEPVTQSVIDNGQHLLMGCYRATFAYLARVGTEHLVEQQPRLVVPFVEPGGGLQVLCCPRLPAPLHLLGGLWRFPPFPRVDYWRLLRWALSSAWRIRRSSADVQRMSVAQWLALAGQGREATAWLWEPLTLAIMNETPQRAAAAPFLRMLREGLCARSVPQGVAIPRVGLSRLLVEPALAYLRARHGVIYETTSVDTLLARDDAIIGLRTRRSEEIAGDAYILAIPPHPLHQLMAASGFGQEMPWAALAEWETVPIIAVHLWFPQPVLPQPMVGLVGSPFHWAFDRSRLEDDPRESSLHSVALVSSACREMATWSRAAVTDAAIHAMLSYFPAARTITPAHVQITRELRATVSLGPENLHLRLGTQTAWRNLFLAGDWTATGLPATIEGAVRSGEAAARAVCLRACNEGVSHV
ncbi:MAG: FAD-dependent oxidoreductase [Deltaproteobacteria bacterium]|nr:FAD-dependent oxidoreductase [Deltaproteobacteria bacterium]